MRAYTRVTTFNRALSDNRALELWRGRMVAKGIAERDDLRARAAAAKVDDRDTLNEVAEAALEAAKGSSGRNLGSALHAFVEQVNRGETPAVPADWAADIDAYRTALDNAGLRVVPSMVERVTRVEEFTVAGTFDMILTDGQRFWVGDLKSSPNVQYAIGEIAIQLACYARGVNESGVLEGEYGRDRYGRYLLPDDDDRWYRPRHQLEVDRAAVVHLPPGQGTCEIIWIDIAHGWEMADLCHRVRQARTYSVARRTDDGYESRLILSPPDAPETAPAPTSEPDQDTPGDAAGPGNPQPQPCLEGERQALVARFEGLPADLQERVVATCKFAGLRGPKHAEFSTADVAPINTVLVEHEELHAQRRQECSDALVSLSLEHTGAILATVGFEPGTPVTEVMRDHIVALAYAVNVGLVQLIDSALVAPDCVDRLGGPGAVVHLAGKIAPTLGKAKPRTSAQAAADPLLIALVGVSNPHLLEERQPA